MARKNQFGERNPNFKHGLSRDKSMRAEYERRSRAKFPGAFGAKYIVAAAIAAGTLVRQPCEQCGATDVQAHHEDYRQPLVVRWLCGPCHAQEHRVLKAAGVSLRALSGTDKPPSRLAERAQRQRRPVSLEAIREFHLAGCSAVLIARKLGVSRDIVVLRLKDLGLKPHPVGRRPHPSLEACSTDTTITVRRRA